MHTRTGWKRTSFLLIAAALLLNACTSIQFGSDFDPKAFASWVQRGETPQSEILAKLGNPTSTGAVVENDGTYYTRWLYYYGKGKIYKLRDADFKMLEIRFNSEKKVSSYNWSAP